jgi:branched-chain amino acid transport system ATP-binding protein
VTPLLRTARLTAGYGGARVIHGLDVTVGEREIVAIVGPNGAGKTTLARSLAGFTRIFGGSIELGGENITRLAPDRRVARGIASVPEGRRLFVDLTVEHNLELALYARRRSLTAGRRHELLASAYERFPILQQRLRQRAGSLSGGEQQMLAIARALMLEPELLILDEPSTGLAPIIVREIFDSLQEIVRAGLCGCLLIEQQAVTALEIADSAYLLSRGEIVTSGPARALRDDEALRDRYLGGGVEAPAVHEESK